MANDKQLKFKRNSGNGARTRNAKGQFEKIEDVADTTTAAMEHSEPVVETPEFQQEEKKSIFSAVLSLVMIPVTAVAWFINLFRGRDENRLSPVEWVKANKLATAGFATAFVLFVGVMTMHDKADTVLLKQDVNIAMLLEKIDVLQKQNEKLLGELHLARQEIKQLKGEVPVALEGKGFWGTIWSWMPWNWDIFSPTTAVAKPTS